MESKLHDRKSIRLPGYDYTGSGWYFVTICVRDLGWGLATLDANSLKLTRIGEIAQNAWSDVPAHFPNVVVDEFVIMPNHVHGILQIVDGNCNGSRAVGADEINDGVWHFIHVGARHGAPLREKMPPYDGTSPPLDGASPSFRDAPNAIIHHPNNAFQDCPQISKQNPQYNESWKMIPGSLGMIINHYKGRVVRWCKKNGYESFKWQRNYYERIIRSEYELECVRRYIGHNPLKLIDEYGC